MAGPEAACVVFARLPVAGRSKTRLIPALGAQGAADLAWALLRRTLATAQAAAIGRLVLCLEGPAGPAALGALVDPTRWTVLPQAGADLGARMRNVIALLLMRHRHVVLVGSDIADLTAGDLQQASAMLDEGKDVALGPAEDGGYYLIGLRADRPALFTDLPWGTDRVYALTLARCAAAGLAVGVLPARRDVDRPGDLGQLELGPDGVP